MTVFRSAQGVFLPAISDNDEYQYWRIMRTDSNTPGEPIKGGDSIRLCWLFSDQVTGFRDFTNDVFGRRRNQCPPELESTALYLKVPWPRFEVNGTPTAMVMSSRAETTDVTEPINVLPGGRFDYVLQDLKMRIDTVERQGQGDANDYMLRGIQQQGDKVTIETTFGPRGGSNPLGIWKQVTAIGM